MSRAGLALLARTNAHRRLVAQAERSIANALEVMKTPYVAFSSGKDSSVLLSLGRQQCPDLPAIYGDDEWRLPETDALLVATPHLRRVALTVVHAEWFTANEEPPPEDTEWLDTTPRWAAHLGYDGVFLGLRAEESARRRMYLRRVGVLYFGKKRQMWHCNPLAWWTVDDVWAYLLSREVPYNAAYDVLERIGVPLEAQRIGPFAVARALGYGQLAILKRGWPDLYNQFAARYPEAHNDV